MRLTPDLVRLVAESQRPGETIPAVMRRLIGDGEIRYALPSDIYENVEDARGVAVLRAVEKKLTTIEKPLSVRVRK